MLRALSVCLLSAASLLSGPVAAPIRVQKSPPPGKSPPKPEAKKEKLSDAEEWKRLITRKEELIREFESLSKQPKPEDDAGRAKAARQLQQLAGEFRGELLPGITKLAPRIYEKDPTDPDAAEFLIAQALSQEGNSRKALEMADKVIDAGRGTAPIFTYKGISQFNCNEFEASRAALEEARKTDEKTFPQLGEPQLAETMRYIEFWKAEEAIRAKEAEADDLPRVLLKTNRGEIELELFENEAPNTVANFVSLVEAKKYDGIVFHRLEPGFVIQGGDLSSRDGSPAKEEGPGYTIACECYTENARKHFQGSLSMAHAGRDTGGSQFFITHRPTAHLNFEEGKSMNNHTVFGRVIRGLDVALSLKKGDKIETARVVRKRDHKYVPETLAEKRRRGSRSKKQ